MPPYHPTSRRPIADVFRRTAAGAVRLCVRTRIHPDAISYLSIVAAALAAVCFWWSGRAPWLLIVGPLFCYFRLWCNMLDGMVALAADKASHRGELMNDLPDRASDVLIFAGLAHGGLCDPISGTCW
jgi:phosphatidylglycerophosphate synthase